MHYKTFLRVVSYPGNCIAINFPDIYSLLNPRKIISTYIVAVCRLSLASLLCFRQLVVIRTYFFFLNFYITASNGFINFQPQTQFLKFILLRFFFLFFLFVSKILQILGLSLEFQKFFSITRTIFSHSRSEQFW